MELEKSLNEYLEKIEKYLKPLIVSERVDIVKEIKSEIPNFLSCFPSCLMSKQTRRFESSTFVLWLKTLRLPET